MLLQMKSISYTTQQCRPFQEDEETVPQKLVLSVPVFVDMGAPVKTQVENGLINFFDIRVQTIDVSDQAVLS